MSTGERRARSRAQVQYKLQQAQVVGGCEPLALLAGGLGDQAIQMARGALCGCFFLMAREVTKCDPSRLAV